MEMCNCQSADSQDATTGFTVVQSYQSTYIPVPGWNYCPCCGRPMGAYPYYPQRPYYPQPQYPYQPYWYNPYYNYPYMISFGYNTGTITTDTTATGLSSS